MKKQKITSVFLALGLFASLLFQVPISAEEADQSAAVEASGTISTNSISGWPQTSDISSEAAVVMENTPIPFSIPRMQTKYFSPEVQSRS